MADSMGVATRPSPAGAPVGAGTQTYLPAESTGAARIKWGALAGLLGLGLSIAGIVIAITALPLGSVAFTSASGSEAIMNTIFAGVLAVVAGVFLAFVAFLLYVTGFRSLRTADNRFRVPMVLGVVGLLGILLVGGFTIFYAASISAAIGCPVSDVNCQNNATTLARGVVVMGYVGGLLGFVGLIGTVVGLYRFGSRYSNTLAKVGGILYVIPFLAVVAPILVLIGAHQVQGKMARSRKAAPPASPAG